MIVFAKYAMKANLMLYYIHACIVDYVNFVVKIFYHKKIRVIFVDKKYNKF